MIGSHAQRRQDLSSTRGAPPKDPDKILQDMIEIVRVLRSIYERETDALQNMDTNGFLAVQDEKFAVAKDYQSGVETILSHKAEIRKADPLLKKELQRLQEGFNDLTRKNMDALKRMQRTMDRLGNTIRKAVKEETRKHRSVNYGANGTFRDDEKKRISLGMNETA